MRTNESDSTKHTPAPAAPRRARRAAAVRAPRTRARRPSKAAAIDRPDADAIRVRAYQFYVERGGVPGDPVADWLRAEAELIAERG